MAIYHCSIKIIGRSKGRSAVASAAYRAGVKLQDKETGITHDFSQKKGVVHAEILLPWLAPEEYQDRETLWNSVQKVETQRNAQLAREIEVALPREMSREQQIEAVREYVKWYFVQEGMCADWALHDKGDGNPHAHILLTTRPIRNNGRWGEKQRSVYKLDSHGQKIPLIDPKTGQQKVRQRKGKGSEKLWVRESRPTTDWNEQWRAEEWRRAWADICNQYLEPEQQIDHRSYARQGIELEPTRHEGYVARKIQTEFNAGKRMTPSELVVQNQIIKRRNAALMHVRAALEAVAEQLRAAIQERTWLLVQQEESAANDYLQDVSSGWDLKKSPANESPSIKSARLSERLNAAKDKLATERSESGLTGQNQGDKSTLQKKLKKKKNRGWER